MSTLRWKFSGKSLILLITTFLLALFSSHPASSGFSDGETKPRCLATRIERAIELSGKLDDPLWNLGQPVALAYEIQPGENIAAPQRTLATALYTTSHLYIGFRCYDSRPQEIRANRTDRDRIFSDDYVMAVLDTYGDYQRGYEFAVNPYGIQADRMKTLNSEDGTFDLVWHSAAARNDSGWTAELAIPFESLRFPNRHEQKWSLLLYRVYPRASRVIISWTPYDRNNPSDLSQAGFLTGLADVDSGGSFELLPYAMAQQAGSLLNTSDPASGFSNNKIQGRVGGGIQYSPTSSFSLDAVVNPDFSQIESDADQISVNTTFALYYPEKRPFFLTGQELLQTPMYYSRSINNPLGAARITGKSGSLSYMYLSAYDRNTPFDVPGEEGSNTFSSSHKSFSNIGRLRYEFGNEAYLGSMILMRDFPDGHNYLFGLDWTYKFWGNWYFSGEGCLSQTKELNDTVLFASDRRFGSTRYTAGFNGERYSGSGLHLTLSHTAREYNIGMEINNISPTFQTYSGLFSLVGYRYIGVLQGYTFYPENSVLDRASIRLSTTLLYNYDGVKKEQVVQPGIYLQFKSQTNIDASYLLVNDEKFHGVQFNNLRRFIFNLSSEPIRELSFQLDGQIGKFISRSSSPEMGSGHSFHSTLTVRPTSRLKVDLSYSRAHLSSLAADTLFFDGYVLRSVAAYQFTTEIFLRGIIQYNSFEKSFHVYPLFSYKLNAFTTFYVGLTNDYLDYGDARGFATTCRQFFLKLQYLIRNSCTGKFTDS
jgi:hypothetical protein